MVSACTIIARNYLAHARVLADSFRRHHPDGDFTVLLIDDEERRWNDADRDLRVLRPGDIGLDAAEIRRLAAIYDVTELATGVKPPLLRHLLAEGRAHVVYLDPDIRIYAPLDELGVLAARHGIVLTPHTLAPFPLDGRLVRERDILSAGVYNLGFVAVGRGADRFLDWWWLRTRRGALVDPERMMFTDQRWIDLAPCYFDALVLKHRGCNVAYWNLHERDLAWTGDRYEVSGEPLVFFHFSGYAPAAPHLLSRHQGERPRVLLSDRPALARLCAEYAACLREAGCEQLSAVPYGWAQLASGVQVDPPMRRIYLQALQEWEEGRGPEPPNPFDTDGGEAFLAWLAAPAAAIPGSGFSRYLLDLYGHREEVRQEFPDLAGDDGRRFLEWARTLGPQEGRIPLALLPAAPPARAEPPREGVNLAGYLDAELGIGEAARLLSGALREAGIPQATIAYERTPSRRTHPFDASDPNGAPYDVNVVCVNADQLPAFARDAGPSFADGRHRVGYWFWELEAFPRSLHRAFDHVDEVWCASAFVERSIRAAGRVPVYAVPLPISAPSAAADGGGPATRAPFTFLFMFDFLSVLERKNPIGLIDAFRRAFAPGAGARLVIKTINGDLRLSDLERLRAATAVHPDVELIDGYYASADRFALLRSCDCYVSLHRSEGYGLTIAEAMAIGKPVVATAYSGNLDFMTAENSYLVDYVMARVPARCDPYPEGASWADPDLDGAAACLRRVYEARHEAGEKGARAAADIRTKHSARVTAAHLRRRLDDIRNRRRSVVAPGAVPSEIGRIERERLEADRRYNAALTAVDQSLPRPAAPLTPGPEFDGGDALARLNHDWDILVDRPRVPSRGVRFRLAAFVWRLLEPHLERQRAFNSVLVDHLNRAGASARAWLEFMDRAQRDRAAFDHALARFHSLMVQYAQQIALFVDARDLATAAQLKHAMDRLADDLTGAVWDHPRTRARRFLEIEAELDALEARLNEMRAQAGAHAPQG
jgi:glycosyltransferase involved in cell wall biosynthesis